ncbi:hypothetical protein A0Z51_04120 [Campylobacter upsaliensis]|nr:hypothetical protein [Campylobacter upsaliensis]EAK0456559.1 hypothetical protein [Campylobacter upsaliensis]EAK0963940.1 hypothetical protein [Campylobacter upsaliensis]EAK6151940.1 hypothetical protein [Campylobacter upsaliensis]ELB7667820.1 hypothetical protein [Campylobacter upsaliensis]
MSESAIASASALGSLSGAGLLGLMVLALAGVVIHLYKKQSEIVGEKQEKQLKNLEDIKQNLKENSAIQKATLDTYKENNKTMMEFIREHCKNTNDELKKANDKLDKIDDDLDALKGVGAWFKDLHSVGK